MRLHGFIAAAVWLLLGAAHVYRGGFAFGFVFYAYSLLCLYGVLTVWIGLRGVKATRFVYEEGSAGIISRSLFTAGDEAAVEITLWRRLPVPLPWIAIRDQAGDWRYDRLSGPWLGTELKYRYVLPLPARGVYRFGSVELWSGDPFGIITSRVRIAMPDCEAVAAPKPHIFSAEAEKTLLSRAVEDRLSGDLRAFVQGDPMKHIVWKIAARTGKWMVRTSAEAEYAKDTALLVDASAAGHQGDPVEMIDIVAEAAAGVSFCLSRHRRPFTLWDGQPASHREWAHRLALLQPNNSAGFAEGAKKAILPGTESVIIVSPKADSDSIILCRELRARGLNVVYVFASTRLVDRERDALDWIGSSGCRVVSLQPRGGVSREHESIACIS